MKVSISINSRNRNKFDRFISDVIPVSYQVDIMSNHSGMKSKYEIPYENENQKRTILNLQKILK